MKNLRVEKASLRKKMKRALQEFASNKMRVDCASRTIAKKLCAREEYKSAEIVFAFLGTKTEVQTDEIIACALREKKLVALPRVRRVARPANAKAKNEMDFFLLRENLPLASQVHKGTFGILEPNEDLEKITMNDVENKKVLTLFPGLAFSKSGERLGKGGGFYDTYFAPSAPLQSSERALDTMHSNKRMVKCGLCFSFQVVDDIPHEAHDLQVDFVISEVNV